MLCSIKDNPLASDTPLWYNGLRHSLVAQWYMHMWQAQWQRPLAKLQPYRLRPSPNAKVVTNAKMANAKAKAKAKFQPFVSDLACPFRNLMKYKISEKCKKAIIM